MLSIICQCERPLQERKNVFSDFEITDLPKVITRSGCRSDKLVFKGGTLLTKNFLKYHRISEDLDFTHIDCNYIRSLPNKSQVEKQIKDRVLSIIDEVKLMCSFPKDFKLIGSESKQWARLGNAVMPNFMCHIAKHIKKTILD